VRGGGGGGLAMRVQGRRDSFPVARPPAHLDHPGDPGRRRRSARLFDLIETRHSGLPRRPRSLAVGGSSARARIGSPSLVSRCRASDGVEQRRARGPAAASAASDDPLLAGPDGEGQPVGLPVLLTAAARTPRGPRIGGRWACSVGQPLQGTTRSRGPSEKAGPVPLRGGVRSGQRPYGDRPRGAGETPPGRKRAGHHGDSAGQGPASNSPDRSACAAPGWNPDQANESRPCRRPPPGPGIRTCSLRGVPGRHRGCPVPVTGTDSVQFGPGRVTPNATAPQNTPVFRRPAQRGRGRPGRPRAPSRPPRKPQAAADGGPSPGCFRG